MNVLALSPLGRMAGFGLLAARVILGIIMTAHGIQKLIQMGAGAFGKRDARRAQSTGSGTYGLRGDVRGVVGWCYAHRRAALAAFGVAVDDQFDRCALLGEAWGRADRTSGIRHRSGTGPRPDRRFPGRTLRGTWCLLTRPNPRLDRTTTDRGD